MTVTIAIVEDDESVRDSLEVMLSIAGYQVHSFHSGKEFLSELPSSHNLCALIDFHLPGISGLEIVSHLRANEYWFPVIMVSGTESPDLANRAIQAGANVFLRKPYRPNSLITEIHTVVRAHYYR